MHRTLQYSVVSGIWGSIFPIKISSDHLAVDHRFPRKVSSYVLTWLRISLHSLHMIQLYFLSLAHFTEVCGSHLSICLFGAHMILPIPFLQYIEQSVVHLSSVSSYTLSSSPESQNITLWQSFGLLHAWDSNCTLF